MKKANLILIGGAVVLVGLYLINKKTKDKAKADAEAQVLAEALELTNTYPQVNSNLGVTPQECAKLGKKYKELQIQCITAPCNSMGLCE